MIQSIESILKFGAQYFSPANRKTVKIKHTPLRKFKYRQNRKNSRQSLKIYVHRVLKQVHPDIGITAKTMSIMNSFMQDMFEKIAKEASFITKMNKKSTIGLREIQTAVQLIIPGDLGHYALKAGSKATFKYNFSK
jgi:histone H2B